MDEKELNVEKLKTYWVLEAEEALQVANHLVEKGDYSYALFFGHLAVEKILKSLYVIRRRKHAPQVHNLLRLAKAGCRIRAGRRQGRFAHQNNSL